MAFDIAKALGDISRKPDGQKQIQYIPLHLIDTNPKNNYSTNGIESLAANIQMFGLLDPLIVKETPDRRYMLISGHRRRLALRMNAEAADNYPDSMHEPVPCIVEPEDAPLLGIEDPEKAAAARPLAEELKLIYANADTRVMSSADTAQQVRRIRELFTELQDLGYKFPGKMRDHVAAAAKVSATRVARLDVIKKGLTEPALRKAWKDGTLGETSAYEIARHIGLVQEAAADRIGLNALSSMTTEKVAEALRGISADMNRESTAAKDLQDGLDRFSQSAAEDRNQIVNDYLKQRQDEDDEFLEALAEMADHYFSALGAVNTRQEGIERLKKGFRHNGGCNSTIDYQGSGRGLSLQRFAPRRGKEITRTWTDVYDMLCTIALSDEAIKTSRHGKVSAADTGDDGPDPDAGDDLRISSPAWIQGEPDHDGRYFCRVLIGKDEKPHEQRMEWRDGGWRVFGDSIDKYDMTVQGWWPLPPEV